MFIEIENIEYKGRQLYAVFEAFESQNNVDFFVYDLWDFTNNPKGEILNIRANKDLCNELCLRCFEQLNKRFLELKY
jgi:hypothetical protein